MTTIRSQARPARAAAKPRDGIQAKHVELTLQRTPTSSLSEGSRMRYDWLARVKGTELFVWFPAGSCPKEKTARTEAVKQLRALRDTLAQKAQHQLELAKTSAELRQKLNQALALPESMKSLPSAHRTPGELELRSVEPAPTSDFGTGPYTYSVGWVGKPGVAIKLQVPQRIEPAEQILFEALGGILRAEAARREQSRPGYMSSMDDPFPDPIRASRMSPAQLRRLAARDAARRWPLETWDTPADAIRVHALRTGEAPNFPGARAAAATGPGRYQYEYLAGLSSNAITD